MLQVNHPLSGKAIVLGDPAPLMVRVAEDCARFSLRIDPSEAAAVAEVFGIALPVSVGSIVQAGERLALMLGPDEWLLTAPLADAEGIEAAFSRLQTVHSLVDTGHRELSILVEGESAATALRSAIAFDVEAMPPGTGCRTVFDKAQIVLLRDTELRFRIEVWRSFADHVWGVLQAASREIAIGI
jgi:sarcosine oxidase subunit gamma